ncbi:glucan 1,4-alpha-glucosidase [Geomonas limicola]|uniref:Glucan 1,4-alpha-glucosidase n=1 Tax=Geomonas limicola TaxID=2740186 RepID=A0A6V8N2U6_9BACT|nr:glycoside hydrolase family 15 protein [Geomonas limicola]GFO66680.1 glucan 1,4-alpha-glucosidase [Geomonas limicola]
MRPDEYNAPGWPGVAARWTSSAKSGVGTALSGASPLWFTVGHGIVNEIYYPRIDRACVRDLGLVVTDGARFFSEEQRDTSAELTWLAPGVPAFRVVTRCNQGRYLVEKELLSDPRRPVLLQQTSFRPFEGGLHGYRLFVLLAPHLGNQGGGNNAWLGEYKGVELLCAERNGLALALACSVPWLVRSAGYVGRSDGWQDLKQHGSLSWQYSRADNGNVALCAEIDLAAQKGSFLLALGFGEGAAEAGQRARSALCEGFPAARDEYLKRWNGWQQGLLPLDEPAPLPALYRVSTALLRCHEAGHFPGGVIASLSIPWGENRGDNDLGGYHLAWPRDLVQAAGGFLAVGARDDARRALGFLEATQEADGHWVQNLWLDGTPGQNGIQLDETALPVLLVDLARREGGLQPGDLERFWPMVRKALGYLVRVGPVSGQDRWEEDPGYSPFTVAAQVAALLAGADLAESAGEPSLGRYLRETADVWNDSLERWMYQTDSDWCREFDLPGYYVRVAVRDPAVESGRTPELVPLRNRPAAEAMLPVAHLVSPDALALVRFGLRAADDPRIVATLHLVDALLKLETDKGPAWYRYNGDGYGEHEDGTPFDGTGRGRPWPLLTGERAHFELAAGRQEEARRLKGTLEGFASREGLLSEQIWDDRDLPARKLYRGGPTGSAQPLVWAHAEYLKLVRSLADGKVFDLPPQTVKRYLKDKVNSPRRIWRFNHKLRTMDAGLDLRIETLAPALIYWSCDGWETVRHAASCATGLGLEMTDLETAALAAGKRVIFTFYWPDAGTWEGTDYLVTFEAAGQGV